MILLESARSAIGALLANRGRSLLTMLGTYIGVTAVVLVMAVSTSARQIISTQLDAIGADSVQVTPRSAGFAGSADERAGRLTPSDLEALREPGAVPSARAFVPTIDSSAQLTAGARSFRPFSFTGTTPEYLDVLGRRVTSGVPFTEEDVDARRRVALLGRTVATRLFGDAPAVGQRIRVEGSVFEVIGLLDRKGATFGFDNDNAVVAPITAVVDTLGGDARRFSSIYAAPVEGRSGTDVAVETVQVLDRIRNVTDPERRDYDIFDASSFVSSSNRITGVLAVVLAGIAGISLVVGGVGVMNIMLVTVTERTREIGLRKAVGGRRRHVLVQFLVEATVLTLLAGAAAVATVMALAQIRLDGIGLVVEPTAVALALAVSAGVGIFFGWFPARRAARLRPIEALRYE